MKVVKQTAEYTIYQKRNQRYGVKGANKKWINGDDKVKVLLDADLIKLTAPAAPAAEEAPAEDAPATEIAEAPEESKDPE